MATYTDIDSSSSGNSTDDGYGSGFQGNEDGNNIALMVVRIFVCALGTVGNVMVIFVILVLQEYRKDVTHWYVLQLAFADSIFLLTLPFKVVEDAHGEWIFPGGMCKAKETILFLNYYASILILVVMSVDRYIAVCHAFSNVLQKLRTKCAAITITAVIWTMSAFMCIPVMLYSDKMGSDPNCKCQYEFPKPLLTPEEHCKSEGWSSEDEMKDCLALKSLSNELCQKIDLDDIIKQLGTHESTALDYYEDGSTHSYDDATSHSYDDAFTPSDDDASSHSYDDAFTHSYDNPTDVYEMGCSYVTNSRKWITYICFNFVMMFIIPFMIMSVCYYLIALWIRKAEVRRKIVTNERSVGSDNTTPGKFPKKKSASSAKERRKSLCVNFVCLILVFSFFVCWFPFHVIHLAKIKGIRGTSAFCANLSAVSSIIAYLNSALNPFIYNFIGRKFGGKIRKAAGSIRQSVRKRASSLSTSEGTVRYRARWHGRGVSSSSGNATMMTKNYRSKSETSRGDTSGDVTQAQESSRLD